MPKPDESDPRKGIRLRRLRVRNFKVLDDLDLELPPPQLPGDPDVLVMGSRNGLGKTSVLEACALLFLGSALFHRKGRPEFPWRAVFAERELPLDFLDLMIRAGQDEARMDGELEIKGAKCRVRVSVYRPSGHLMADGDLAPLDEAVGSQAWRVRDPAPEQTARQFLSALAGANPDPLICPPLLYFHSYRRVSEGNTKLGKMVDRDASARNGRSVRAEPMSAFKLTVLKSMMGRKGVFEGIESTEADEAIGKLDGLMHEYAEGSFDKPRLLQDDSIEFRVSREGTEASFPLDGLSSGQKEIISTFFLIWQHTHAWPGIVLIDEPELHLNAEWQVGFIRQLHRLVPDNQLIIATHSEDIAGSVEPSRRVLLEAGKGTSHGRG